MDVWLRAASLMAVPYDTQRGVHMQSDAFTHHEEWDFANTPQENYPLLLHYPYFEIYRKQVVKQADLVMALHLRGDAFTLEEKIANFAYYEARTTRDSSLSASQQAVVAAETGHLQLAYDYWAEAALTDLQNLHHNSGHGLHIASLAGGWTVAVAGFGGMRDHNGELTFGPRLPERITRMRFRVVYRGRKLTGHGDPEHATYRLEDGRAARHPPPRPADHRRTTDDLVLDIPPAPKVDPVRQPLGLRAAPPGAGRPAAGARVGEGLSHAQASSQRAPRTQCARRRPAGRRPTQNSAGSGVSRASWSASESGARRRRRDGLQLEDRRAARPAAGTRWRPRANAA